MNTCIKLRRPAASRICESPFTGILIFLAGATVCASAGADSEAGKPTLDDAMAVPASHLAQGYLASKSMLKNVLPMLEMDVAVTVHAGGEKITPKNASRFKKAYQERLETYETAIQMRGTESFDGTYRAEATRACGRAGSFWIGIISEDDAAMVRIRQDGHNATLAVQFEHEGETTELENAAAIVEDAIVVADTMNSDYYAVGALEGRTVTIRPDPGVLDSWPGWAAPPKRKNLLACKLTLTKQD